MKYKAGDRVKIKSLDWYNKNKDEYGYIDCGSRAFFTKMSDWCGKIATIKEVCKTNCYRLEEYDFDWTDEMIEELVEEEEVGLIDGFSSRWINEFNLPEGYIFKDENGNVINATKIVLEKKKTKYPKTYQECCKVLGIDVRDLDILYNMLDTTEIVYSKNLDRLLNSFRKLLICRDAYWKIAGQEMGLGKSWEPSGNEDCFVISRSCGEVYLYSSAGDCEPFEFPTEKMRDAFKENFDPDIEICKEFL